MEWWPFFILLGALKATADIAMTPLGVIGQESGYAHISSSFSLMAVRSTEIELRATIRNMDHATELNPSIYSSIPNWRSIRKEIGEAYDEIYHLQIWIDDLLDNNVDSLQTRFKRQFLAAAILGNI